MCINSKFIIGVKSAVISPLLFLLQMKKPKTARRSKTPPAPPTTGPTGNTEGETEKVQNVRSFTLLPNQAAVSSVNASLLNIVCG